MQVSNRERFYLVYIRSWCQNWSFMLKLLQLVSGSSWKYFTMEIGIWLPFTAQNWCDSLFSWYIVLPHWNVYYLLIPFRNRCMNWCVANFHICFESFHKENNVYKNDMLLLRHVFTFWSKQLILLFVLKHTLKLVCELHNPEDLWRNWSLMKSCIWYRELLIQKYNFIGYLLTWYLSIYFIGYLKLCNRI